MPRVYLLTASLGEAEVYLLCPWLKGGTFFMFIFLSVRCQPTSRGTHPVVDAKTLRIRLTPVVLDTRAWLTLQGHP